MLSVISIADSIEPSFPIYILDFYNLHFDISYSFDFCNVAMMMGCLWMEQCQETIVIRCIQVCYYCSRIAPLTRIPHFAGAMPGDNSDTMYPGLLLL